MFTGYNRQQKKCLTYLPYREFSTSLGSFEMFKQKMRRHLRQLKTEDVLKAQKLSKLRERGYKATHCSMPLPYSVHKRTKYKKPLFKEFRIQKKWEKPFTCLVSRYLLFRSKASVSKKKYEPQCSTDLKFFWSGMSPSKPVI